MPTVCISDGWMLCALCRSCLVHIRQRRYKGAHQPYGWRLSPQDSVTSSQTGKSSVRLWRSQSTGGCGCDAVGTSSASSCHVSVRQRMSMPWVVNRSLVASTLFRSDRTLKAANFSCGSGRPTWCCRAAGSGLVEAMLAIEIVERSADQAWLSYWI